MKFPIADRDKVNYGKPTCTFDVNLVALRPPQSLSTYTVPVVIPVYQLEFNYFEYEAVELCVTPETEREITKGVSVSSLGYTAYMRFQKTRLFKSRPPGATLDLSEDDANTLWTNARNILFPTVDDKSLNPTQLSDVTQVFYHTASSGTLLHSAFVTNALNFLRHSGELKAALGITIMEPEQAWKTYQHDYDLYVPNQKEIEHMWQEQQTFFKRLREEASVIS